MPCPPGGHGRLLAGEVSVRGTSREAGGLGAGPADATSVSPSGPVARGVGLTPPRLGAARGADRALQGPFGTPEIGRTSPPEVRSNGPPIRDFLLWAADLP
jgi:hypothetical protein